MTKQSITQRNTKWVPQNNPKLLARQKALNGFQRWATMKSLFNLVSMHYEWGSTSQPRPGGDNKGCLLECYTGLWPFLLACEGL